MIGSSLKRRAREIWQKLSRLDAHPGQIAAGFSIGIAASFLPLNPSPIVLATVLAWLLRMNMIAAVAGGATAILYTPLVPLIWWAEYRTGTLFLAVKRPLSLDHANLWEFVQKGWDVYAAMLIGALIIATPVTLFTFLVVRQLARRWARQRGASPRSN